MKIQSWDGSFLTATTVTLLLLSQDLTLIIRFCLEEAEKLQMRSLSFPAIGTGNLNFPRDLVCVTLLREIHSFSSRRGSRHLGQVFIVVHPTDTETDAVSANLAKAVRSLSSACTGELDGILHVVRTKNI